MQRIWIGFLLLAGLAFPQANVDRLGRTTPKASFMAFLRTAHEGNFAKASHYVQFASEIPEPERIEMCRELLFVLDRGFVANLDTISSKPEGTTDDGLGADHETIGSVIGAEQSYPVRMVRVNDNGVMVWLLGRETVGLVPLLFPEFGFPSLEKRLPRQLIDTHFLSMPLWVLLAIFVALPISLGVAWLLAAMVARALPDSWGIAHKPNLAVVAFIGLFLHNVTSRLLGLPLLYRVWYTRVLLLLWVALWVWIIFGLISYADRRIRQYLMSHSLNATQSILQLGRRLLQVFVLLGAILFTLNGFGYDITAALAGLGIGGIAIAFAAQKTLENLFGGFSILSDQSIRVGDSCQFGTVTATVEDIGLRATRFRTVQRSVMFIPNGQLATMTIENLGLRDRILFRHTLGVKYGLQSSGMRELLDELRELIEKDVRVASEGRRVQFLKFGAYSLDIELFCYILTSDYAEFLRIQEELLLRVMEIVRKHDSDFAFPSQTLYVEQGKLELGPVMEQSSPVATSGSSQTA